MYTFDNIAFRPIEKADLQVLLDIHNSTQVFLNLASIDMSDYNGQVAWWESINRNKTDKRYAIVMAQNPEEIIGRLRIQNIDRQNQNCEVGLDIHPKFQGQGYGKKSYDMLLEFLFLHFNMNMVYLKVADFNPNAKKLYHKVGFVQTGYFPSYFYRHGKYWDYLIMSMTREQFLEKKTATK